MTYKDNDAVFALNSYVWKLLEANLGWKEVGGIKPILPLAQAPEIMDEGVSFLTYSASKVGTGHLYQLEGQTVAYTIFSPTYSESHKISNVMYDALHRQDDSAADINQWLVTEAAGTGKHRGVSFTTTRAYAIDDPEPEKTEGGFSSSALIVEINFLRDDTGIETSGFTF